MPIFDSLVGFFEHFTVLIEQLHHLLDVLEVGLKYLFTTNVAEVGVKHLGKCVNELLHLFGFTEIGFFA